MKASDKLHYIFLILLFSSVFGMMGSVDMQEYSYKNLHLTTSSQSIADDTELNFELNSSYQEHQIVIEKPYFVAWENYYVESSNPDLDIKLSLVDNSSEEVFLWSDHSGVGQIETLFFQPYAIAETNNAELILEVERISGEGMVDLLVKVSDQTEVVPQRDGINDYRVISVSQLTLISLNYSRGADISVRMDPLSSETMEFDYYLYPMIGNSTASRTEGSLTISSNDVASITFNPITNSTIDGLLLVLKQATSVEMSMEVRSKVTVPGSVGDARSIDEISNVKQVISEGVVYYLEIGATSMHLTLQGNGSFNYMVSRDASFNGVSLISSTNNRSGFLIQDYGSEPISFEVGYSWYYIKVFDPDITLDFELIKTAFDQPEFIIDQQRQNFTLNADNQVASKFISVAEFPNYSVFWAKPQQTLDVKLTVYNSTGGHDYMVSSDISDIGAVESTGNFFTQNTKILFIIIEQISGEGTVELVMNRGKDNNLPDLASIEFSSYVVNNTESVNVSVELTDNFDIYYHEFEISERGMDSWSKIGVPNALSFVPEYGKWDVRLRIYDVGANPLVFDNNSNYYKIDVRDNVIPTVRIINATFLPNEETEIEIYAADTLSGISDVYLTYNTTEFEIIRNKASKIGENLYKTIVPKQFAGTSITIQAFVIDNEANIGKNEPYRFIVDEAILNMSGLVFPTEVNEGEEVVISFDLISNDLISNISMTYIQAGQNVTIYNFEQIGNLFTFKLNATIPGDFFFSLRIETISGLVLKSGTHKLTINAILTDSDNTSDDDTSMESTTGKQSSDDLLTVPDDYDMNLTILAIGAISFTILTTIIIILQRKYQFLSKLR